MNTRRLLTIFSVALAALGMTACGHDEAKTAEASFEPLTVTTAEVELLSASKPIEVRGVVQPTR